MKQTRRQHGSMRGRSTAGLLMLVVATALVVLLIACLLNWYSPAPASVIQTEPPKDAEPLVVSPAPETRLATTPSESKVAAEVVVQDESGSPVGGVALTLGETAHFTDASGGARFEIADEAVAQALLLVSHPRYESQSVKLEVPSTRVILKLLANAISGQLRPSSGLPEYSDMIVIAYPRGRPPAAELLDLKLRRSTTAQVRTATPDVSGAFRIEGVDPGKEYTLEAAGGGHLSVQPAFRVTCTSEKTVLEIAPASLGLVFVRGPSGEDLALPRDYPYTMDYASEMPGKPGFSPALLPLAGIDPSALESKPNILAICDFVPEMERKQPLRVKISALGLGSAQAEVAMAPLSEDPPVTEIRLPRAATGFGSVLVEFLDPPCTLQKTGDLLVMRAPGMDLYRIPLKFMDGSALVEKVPEGSYSVKFQGGHKFEHGTREIHVKANQLERLQVDGSGLGCARLMITDPRGDAYDGQLALLIFRDKDVRILPNGKRQITAPVRVQLRSGPYLLGPIEAGSYGLSIAKPDVAQREFRMEIVAGQDQVVHLKLDK